MKVYVVGLKENAVSESFIRAHVSGLIPKAEYLWVVGGQLKSSTHSITLSFIQKLAGKFLVKGLESKDNRTLWLNPTFKFLKRNLPGLILFEYGTSAVQMIEYLKILKIPFIVIFHGYDISNRSIVDLNKKLYLEIFEYASHVVGVSTSMCSALESLGCSSSKITYTPCAPSDSFFEVVPDNQATAFISVGRFVEKKAPHLTLLAFSKVYRQIPEARLLMVGDGALLGACHWLSKSLGLERAVRFEGALSHDEVLLRFSQAFCFVQHSVIAMDGDSEGTPVAVLEAGAAALPVVSTRHAGISDVVVEGKTGLLVDEGDVEGMAAAMIRLYEDRELCAHMGKAARGHISENFSMEKHIGILNNLVEKAIAEKRVG